MSRPVLALRRFVFLAPLLLLCALSPAQNRQATPGKPTANGQNPDFQVPVDVVVVSASVTDRSGKPVLGLTMDDFKVYEDGKPQPIHTFALESYKPVRTVEDITEKQPPGSEREQSETPDQPRLFGILIDDLTTSRELYYSITEAVKKFVEEDLAPGDQVSLCSASGRVQYPFTADKQTLLAELAGLHTRLQNSGVIRSTCPTLTDLQAQRIALQGSDPTYLQIAISETIHCMRLGAIPLAAVENIVRGAASTQFYQMQDRDRALLRTLREYVRSLRHLGGKKNVVVFSDGFLFEDLVYELQDVVDQALRGGVVLNTVDARGLYVNTFQASEGVNVPLGLLVAKDRLRSEDIAAQSDPLNMLAHDTGGIFHHNSNDLHAGLQKVSDRQTCFYVLTYATPSPKANGRYHSIKLEVARPGLQLSYRKGYYAPKEELTFERRRKEDILEALRAPGNANEIPIRTGYISYQVEDSRYEVELLTQVDIRRIKFVQEDSRNRNLISLVVVAFDEYDRYVDGIEKTVTFNLSPSSYSELLDRGFSSKVVFRMPAGRYRIKTVVRESAESRIGSLTKGIEVP